MKNTGSRVAIVVDRAFGAQLHELSRSRHVWVVESPANASVIHEIWRDTSHENGGSGVTSFKNNTDLSVEEICIGIVPVVEEHHGEFSSHPPWSELEVVGVPLTQTLQSAFEDVGASSFEATPRGFICRRRV